MTPSPFRLGVLTAGFCLVSSFGVAAQTADPAVPQAQPAPVVSSSPAPADEKLAADMVAANKTERHFAPHDTFYVLSYVAVKTANGVEGFDPGQEVRLVEVHRPTQTLVITDGHAQVEVSPSQLTNDMDIAALVRRKDQTDQARIAAYQQAEQQAYNKFQRIAADATAKDLADRRKAQQEQAEAARAQQQTPVAQTAPPVNASVNNGDNAYYGLGGDGYGSPYSYFSSAATVAAPRNSAPTASAPASVGKGANAATVGTAGGRSGGHK